MTALLRFFRRCAWLALLIMLTMGCKPDESPQVSIPSVVVAPAEKKKVPIYGYYVGVTRASLDVEVHARVEGFVKEQRFVDGSSVQKDDILYRIDDSPYQARVKRLNANLTRARAALEKAERDETRLKPLYEQDAASQLDYDTALSDKEKAQADVEASQAELEEAELELSYTEIKAPISGLSGESQVDIGALVGTGGKSLLTTLKQTDPIFVTFNMSALDYLNAQRRIKTYWEKAKAKAKADELGKALEGYVSITLPDDSTYPYLGDIEFTSPSVNPRTGTFSVRAQLPNPERSLLPGQYTRVRIRLDELSGAVVVPEETTQIEQGGEYVMVVMPDHTVEQRFIVTGPRVEGTVVINSGLSAGELIIVEGMHRVRHGQKVNPLTREEYETRKMQQDLDPSKIIEGQGGDR